MSIPATIELQGEILLTPSDVDVRALLMEQSEIYQRAITHLLEKTEVTHEQFTQQLRSHWIHLTVEQSREIEPLHSNDRKRVIAFTLSKKKEGIEGETLSDQIGIFIWKMLYHLGL